MEQSSLPEQFIKGLTEATLQGRAQIVLDQYMNPENLGDLVFYLDGAHSPESMEICARWFSMSIKEDSKHTLDIQPLVQSPCSHYLAQRQDVGRSMKNSAKVWEPSQMLFPVTSDQMLYSQGVILSSHYRSHFPLHLMM